MQDFLHWVVYPLIVTGIVTMCTAAITRPQLFFMIAKPVYLFASMWLLVLVVANVSWFTAQHFLAEVLSKDQALIATKELDAMMTPAWVIVAFVALLALLLLFAFLAKRLREVRALAQDEAEQAPSKN